VRYTTAGAFRRALEERLRRQSLGGGQPLARLRKMVAFDRFLARLAKKEPDAWIVKGGFALQLRLGERARTTKDIDVQRPTAGPGERLSRICKRLHPLISVTGSSLKLANRPKQPQERPDAVSVFQFSACSTAARSRISTWMWDMAIPFSNPLKISPCQTCSDSLRFLQLGFHAIR